MLMHVDHEVRRKLSESVGFCQSDKCLGIFILHFLHCEVEQLFIYIYKDISFSVDILDPFFLLGDWSFSYIFQGALCMLEILARGNMSGSFLPLIFI